MCGVYHTYLKSYFYLTATYCPLLGVGGLLKRYQTSPPRAIEIRMATTPEEVVIELAAFSRAVDEDLLRASPYIRSKATYATRIPITILLTSGFFAEDILIVGL